MIIVGAVALLRCDWRNRSTYVRTRKTRLRSGYRTFCSVRSVSKALNLSHNQSHAQGVSYRKQLHYQIQQQQLRYSVWNFYVWGITCHYLQSRKWKTSVKPCWDMNCWCRDWVADCDVATFCLVTKHIQILILFSVLKFSEGWIKIVRVSSHFLNYCCLRSNR